MKALIFAAGLGTRLKPLTDERPKALVEVGGIPMLERTIMRLKEAGFTDLVINIHHFGDQVIDFLNEHSDFGCNISISDERMLLRETGGGIKYAHDLLSDDEPFLIHNVDIISNLDIRWLMREHCLNDSIRQPLATLLVSERQTSRYFLFDEDNRLVGWTNINSGEVRSPYRNLKIDNCRKLAFAGIHIESQAIFPLMEKWPDKFSITDFYISVCDRYLIRAAIYPGLKLADIGTPEAVRDYRE